MKYLILLLLLVSTCAWRENQRLRANPNGPEGLPVAMYDDSEELAAEDGPMHDYDSPSGDGDDPDLFEMRGWPEPELDDDDDEKELNFEDFGEALEDPAILSQIMEYLTNTFSSEKDVIVSQPGETADCYSFDYVKCDFVAEEFPVGFVIEYEEEPEEYKMTVEHSPPDAEVMRRRLTATNCDTFNTVMSLWNREIECEIKEYSHIVSIKHIG